MTSIKDFAIFPPHQKKKKTENALQFICVCIVLVPKQPLLSDNLSCLWFSESGKSLSYLLIVNLCSFMFLSTRE